MPGEKKGGPRPTVVTPPPARKKPTKTSAEAGKPAPAVRTPTAIPGVERKRIPIDATRLRDLAFGSDARTCALAVGLVQTFVLDKATERKVILWGQDVQTSHSELIAQVLKLSQTPIFVRIEGYIDRMMTILKSIDVVSASGNAQGGIASYFRGINNKIDTPEELDVAQRELDQLIKHMRRGLDELLDLKDQLETQAKRLDELAVASEASALAASFLAQYLQNEKPNLAQGFTQRSASLTQTLTQIRQNDSVREMQINYPLRLVHAIQDVALVALPDVIASIASAVSLNGRKLSLSPTEAGELHYKLRDIISKMAIQEGR
ncbi:hypothetical protein [Dongia sp.]|uniref:hypothetical protein n=1 Tax=Dongia sp. TaxID=1977262 RepID=UPI003750CC0E